MFLKIEHDLKFTYDDYISESWVELRMEPKTNEEQTVNSYYLAVGPRAKVFRYEDWSGNTVRHFSVSEYHREIEVQTRSIVETKPPRVDLDQVTEPPPAKGDVGEFMDYVSFDGPITRSAALRTLFKSAELNGFASLGERVRRLGELVHDRIEYKANVTAYHSAIDEALSHGAGVCQDMAQIYIGLLRLAGIPARYVNGYLHVERADGAASESHAWAEFHSKEHGWVGYDPTGNILPGERHVVVATGRHYDEVPPNRGVYRGNAKESLKAEVRTHEVPAPSVSAFREEIREIAVPVYTEIPGRRSTGPLVDQAEQETQQQQ